MDRFIETTLLELNLSCCSNAVSQTAKPPCCACSKWKSVHFCADAKLTFSASEHFGEPSGTPDLLSLSKCNLGEVDIDEKTENQCNAIK